MKESLANDNIRITYYPKEYVMIVNITNTLIVGRPDNCHIFWEIIKKNMDALTTYSEIYDICKQANIQ